MFLQRQRKKFNQLKAEGFFFTETVFFCLNELSVRKLTFLPNNEKCKNGTCCIFANEVEPLFALTKDRSFRIENIIETFLWTFSLNFKLQFHVTQVSFCDTFMS